jgi:hypothetical protein
MIGAALCSTGAAEAGGRRRKSTIATAVPAPAPRSARIDQGTLSPAAWGAVLRGSAGLAVGSVCGRTAGLGVAGRRCVSAATGGCEGAMGASDLLDACTGTCTLVGEWAAAAPLARETAGPLALPPRRALIGLSAGCRRTVIDWRPRSDDATAATDGFAGRTVTPGSADCRSGSEGATDEPGSGPAVAPVVGWAGWGATAGSGGLACSGAGGAGATAAGAEAAGTAGAGAGASAAAGAGRGGRNASGSR